MIQRVLSILVLVVLGVYLRNASWLADPVETGPVLISHRGVHQTFHRDGLTNDTCTAARMDPPEHEYLENTLPSIAAAFASSAEIVELDIHPTTDGYHAVFHDWTLGCRTEGAGRTRDYSLAYLKSLDVGYGYTSDEGRTFPFRGKGVGMMPSLTEVMDAFSDKHFLINFKSNDPESGEAFAEALEGHPEWKGQIWAVYGGPETNAAFSARYPDIKAFDRRTTKACLLAYFKTGWSGKVPRSCENTVITLPISHRGLMWGWPHAFMARMKAVGTDVILIGPYGSGDPGTTGIDTPEMWAKVPQKFGGYVWTNKIQVIGPLASGEGIGVDIDRAADH